MPRIHTLKCDLHPLLAVLSGDKTCEFRINDRGFEVGDFLILVASDGRQATRLITHIQTGYGIPDGYAMLSMVKRG